MIRRQSTWRTRLLRLLRRCILLIDRTDDARPGRNGEYQFLRFLFDKRILDSHVLDVGAHKGSYSRQILSLASGLSLPEGLHLFEPVGSSFSSLLDLSPIPRVVLNPVGCSDSDGVKSVFSNSSGSSLSSLYHRPRDSSGVDFVVEEDCMFRRLDGYIEEFQIPHISLLKIDVEGHEMSVLQGLGEYLTTDFIDCIQFEYGGTNLDSRIPLKMIYQLLQQRGYTIGRLHPRSLELRDYHPYMENYAYANYVAISPKVMAL